MNYTEASKIIDQAVRRIMERDGLSFDRAFDVLAREKPRLVAAWQSIRRKEAARRERESILRRRLANGENVTK